MAKGPVNKKDIAIETTYGYMNIHLELLFNAISKNETSVAEFQKTQLERTRTILSNLGYFERRNKNGNKQKAGNN